MNVYAYFGCPDTSNAEEYYCCGLPTEQYCCTQSEHSAQTTSRWSWLHWLLNLLKVVVICLVLIGAYQSLRSIYYRCLAQRAPQVVAGTVAYAAPNEQVQVVVATTAGVEVNKERGATTDGQPPSAAI